MDDLNYITQSLSSMLHAFHYTVKFGKASGLEVNFSKSSGMFVNKRNVFSVSQLPGITWSENIEVLKICHGSENIIMKQWNEVLNDFKKSLQYYGATAFTYNAKTIISRSFLLPKLSYLSMVYPIPKRIGQAIDKLLIRFIASFLPVAKYTEREIDSRMFEFAAPIFLGGIQIDHVALHANLFLIKIAMDYVQYLERKEPLPDRLYFLEYNIGFHLCCLLKFPVNNCTPHAPVPNIVYAQVLELIKMYGISREELLKGSVNLIYKRIVIENRRGVSSLNCHRVMAKYLPSYLQTFNYKLNHDLLPVKTMFREYALDNDSVCYFCAIGPESILHVFATCEKLKFLWTFMSKVHFLLTTTHFDYEISRNNFQIDLTTVACAGPYEKVLVYFTSVTNHTLWKIRNDIRYEFKSFNKWNVIQKIIRSIGSRKNWERNLSDSFKIPHIEELYNAVTFVSHLFPFDNG